MKAFHASARDKNRNIGITKPTAQDAAAAFFATFPGKRKCSVIEGTTDGAFFTMRFGIGPGMSAPQQWKDVTPKTVKDLPGADAATAEIDAEDRENYAEEVLDKYLRRA